MRDIVLTLVERLSSSVKNGYRRYIVSAFCVVSVIGIVAGFLFSDARILYKVNYRGKDIAIVDKKEKFDIAEKTVVKMVNGKNVEKAFSEPEYTTVVALAHSINSQNDLVNAIIENTDEIVEGCVFYADGKKMFTAERKTLDECIVRRYEKYRIKGAVCTFSFKEDVVYENGYFLKKDVLSEDEINYALQSLTVKTVAEVSEKTVIPFGTIAIKDDDMIIGSREVMIEGKNGIGKRTTVTVYLNGIRQTEPETKEDVITPAVDEAVNIGVAVPRDLGEMTELPGSGYVFPLSTKRWEVSAYFGDGRGHKGIDLSTSYGVPILSVAAGTVVRSEWYEGYGNCIDIDHGYGFVTRYAHCSELIADVGDFVESGTIIAYVGSTGDSTGDHLHIEFIINGDRIDPAMYLGLD